METAQNLQPVRQVICLHTLLPLLLCLQVCAAHCLARFPRSTHLARQDELTLLFSWSIYQCEGEIVFAERGQPIPPRLQIKVTGTASFGAGGRRTPPLGSKEGH
jgi:hypothetical protein